MNSTDQAFNATPAGQRAICLDADSRATAFLLADFLRKRGVATYDHACIASANISTLAAIKAELLTDYNAQLSHQA
jgi:predicted Zn-dependent protease